jgi:hypothetical protein
MRAIFHASNRCIMRHAANSACNADRSTKRVSEKLEPINEFWIDFIIATSALASKFAARKVLCEVAHYVSRSLGFLGFFGFFGFFGHTASLGI